MDFFAEAEFDEDRMVQRRQGHSFWGTWEATRQSRRLREVLLAEPRQLYPMLETAVSAVRDLSELPICTVASFCFMVVRTSEVKRQPADMSSPSALGLVT